MCLSLNTSIKPHSSGDRSKEYFRLQWSDITFYRFLIDIGLTPNKSLTLGSLKIPDEYFFDFLRGSYDGDGCFYSYFDPRWENSFMFYLTFTSASHNHMLWMRDTIERLCSVRGHLNQTGKKCFMSNLRYAKKESLLVLDSMYSSPSDIYLNRKRLKITQGLAIVGESLVIS